MKKIIQKLLGKPEVKLTRQDAERRQLSEDVKKQFLELKRKGLSIPVFTL